MPKIRDEGLRRQGGFELGLCAGKRSAAYNQRHTHSAIDGMAPIEFPKPSAPENSPSQLAV